MLVLTSADKPRKPTPAKPRSIIAQVEGGHCSMRPTCKKRIVGRRRKLRLPVCELFHQVSIVAKSAPGQISKSDILEHGKSTVVDLPDGQCLVCRKSHRKKAVE